MEVPHCPVCGQTCNQSYALSSALSRHEPDAIRELYARLRTGGTKPTVAVRTIGNLIGLDERQVWRLIRET